MSCREEDAAIPAYCKDDERQGAQKMPQKAWFLFFPYSIVDVLCFGGIGDVVDYDNVKKAAGALFLSRRAKRAVRRGRSKHTDLEKFSQFILGRTIDRPAIV